ncbi:MAG: phosphate/phosphite/phosphonate ABC transporter substrate-binding protein [Candidatus Thiodiazotropha lotti]|uniref:Phosphate/phosphite/phosphonate ABC transporter substrate-binding protein n=1 Tax=Candidatus Thiodiazotropha lotti TaxID=2792787 RepID=A0A9E4K421_9GAMM|nr:phosphate/phosphite/phosphonate ABC transporter substrate-binding protein [Candidatus Thiodiazotropha lotti]ODC00795.1 phosphate ABC transporter substrate-binding protein [Candidatus Thiodiazotropha endoloripes]MCG7938385.1 phosphate/phosphite/phosphonate ABC transporter substrate-binding protein [Candidatus Thiodiazotropha lotti]MCG8002341.1 phosphate/phosphite/phosphonate ABC transporter substrate-binding protein [Candidatus Thiodiazotropha lotti]MCG8006227.1 phosphate/phosphite/phosphonat
MSYRMTVSPDFTPDHICGWYIFNTWLQKSLQIPIHLELYDNYNQQRKAIGDDQIDLIYANPFDASMLVRDKGFIPVARPRQAADEAIIAVNQSSDTEKIEELSTDTVIALTEDPDVNLICDIMLEPAEMHNSGKRRLVMGSYPLVAKALIDGKADIGFFLVEAYLSLSNLTRQKLRVLVRSQINVMHHTLLVGPHLKHQRDLLSQHLLTMKSNNKGSGVLKSMSFDDWEVMNDEEMEFMIDLMDTLNYQPQ